MANTLKHGFTSGKSDGADATQVQPSHWNAEHVFAGGATGSLLIYSASATDKVAWIADVAVGQVLCSGGVNTAPAWSANCIVTGYVEAATGLYSKTNISVLNKAGTGYLAFATRDVTGAEAVYDLAYVGDLSMSGALVASATGGHAFGGSASATSQMRVTGTFTGESHAIGLAITSTLNTTGDTYGAYGLYLSPAQLTGTSGATHPLFAGAYLGAPLIEKNGGTVTAAATAYIQAAPTGNASANYALWVDAGATRLDGQLSVGADINASYQCLVGGSFTPASGAPVAGLALTSTLTPFAANGNILGFYVAPTLVESSSGTHPLLAGSYFAAPGVTAGGAAVTNAATVYIADEPGATVTGANYAFWVDAGMARFDGDVTLAGGLISYGANDSGGAGYRYVRVPNA